MRILTQKPTLLTDLLSTRNRLADIRNALFARTSTSQQIDFLEVIWFIDNLIIDAQTSAIEALAEKLAEKEPA